MSARQGRWSSKKKAELVLRLLRGGAINALTRACIVTVGTLSQRRGGFIETGIAGSREKGVADVWV